MDLLALRKKMGLTQAELAMRLNITQRMVSHYESGTRRPRPEVAEKIGKVLQLTRDELWAMFYAKDAS